MKKARLCPLSLLIAALLAVSLVSPAVASSETVAKTESMLLKVGVSAPLFTLKTSKGEEYTLSDYIGKKAILIFFWSFFCGPCREEMPVLEKVYQQFGRDKMEFLGVNIDGKLTKAIERFSQDMNFSYITLMDELTGMNLKVSDPYGVAATPIVYIIDREGKIAFAGVGRVEPEDLVKNLEKALQ